eukprot:SAG11_NODE_911_length_6582_cov_9.565633_6_plen_252_part_00
MSTSEAAAWLRRCHPRTRLDAFPMFIMAKKILNETLQRTAEMEKLMAASGAREADAAARAAAERERVLNEAAKLAAEERAVLEARISALEAAALAMERMAAERAAVLEARIAAADDAKAAVQQECHALHSRVERLSCELEEAQHQLQSAQCFDTEQAIATVGELVAEINHLMQKDDQSDRVDSAAGRLHRTQSRGTLKHNDLLILFRQLLAAATPAERNEMVCIALQNLENEVEVERIGEVREPIYAILHF